MRRLELKILELYKDLDDNVCEIMELAKTYRKLFMPNECIISDKQTISHIVRKYEINKA